MVGRATDLVRGHRSVSYEFSDRTGESRALAESLVNHMQRVRNNTIDDLERHNVLTFYGIGGQGKTALSKRLESWVTGKLDRSDWGPAPSILPPLVVRWDLDGVVEDLNLASMLIALRRGVAGHRHSWKAFDLAFAALRT